MPVHQKNNIQVEQLLDSDDELPMEYNDISVTPAYQNDNRFDMIQFKWINNFKLPASNGHNSEASSILLHKNYNPFEPITQKGVLKKHDLYCLKSIEGLTGDSTLIWFVNFLILKDLQASYAFLKSCLVSKSLQNESLVNNIASSEQKKYNIIVKT